MLLVDAHYEPEHSGARRRRPTRACSTRCRRGSRRWTSAFGAVGRYPFQACFNSNPAVYYAVACNRFGFRWNGRPHVHGRDGWYPGIEYRPDLDPDDPLFFRDIDASTVVIPSKDNAIYSTRVTDKYGRLVPSQFGHGLADFGFPGNVTGTGNPADGLPAGDDGTPANEADLSLGVKLTVERASSKSARISVRPGHRAR